MSAEMDFAELVRRARSCRRYDESDPIPSGTVRELIDIARVAPSGGNQQPLTYRIVTDPDERKRLFGRLKWAGALPDWPGPAEGERPTAYIVILAEAGKDPATDLGIVGQTIQLGATARGYAACMLGAIDRGGIHETLGLPEDLAVQLVVSLGRPGETIVLEELAPGGEVAYWRDERQVHHVPKRRLEDVLVD